MLGGLRPKVVLAVGESQSAHYLTSFINAVHPLSPVFDGFFVHSRGAGAAPLVAGELARRYTDEAGYRRAFTEALDDAIEAGFLLPAHRDELLAQAGAVSFPPVAAPA